MKVIGQVLTVLVTSFLFISCAQAPQQDIDDFFQEFTDGWIRNNPNLATSLRYFKGEEQDRLERQLTPYTLEYSLDLIDRARKVLAELRNFDRDRMTETQSISAELLEWQLDSVIRREPYLDYQFPLNQFRGANVELVTILTVGHSLIIQRDAENYVAALGQVATRMDEAIAEAHRIAGKGIIPPKFILLATIKQMQSFIDSTPSQNPFVATLIQGMAEIETMTDARCEELREAAERIVSEQVYPAWERGIALLESQIVDATGDAGLWRLERGDEAYRHALRYSTTTDLSPDQIHEIGLKRVREIETQMDILFRQLGYIEGSVNDRIDKLREDLRYPDPKSEESREHIMQDIEIIVRDAEKRAETLFDKKPESPVIVQPVQRFQEANASARYSAPAMDGSRPGIFFYPRRPERMTKFRLHTTVYHETVPGHHFQIALQRENDELPRFRQILFRSSAFGEGWALYAEQLAAEFGWYGDDTEGLLGQLYAALFRARRLVVDTGIHAKQWTRQQAIDYGIEASEVERYVVMPGQACSYMIGLMKFLELRDRAKEALGDKFSIREFHNLALDVGAVPLDIFERQVNAYIRATEEGQ